MTAVRILHVDDEPDIRAVVELSLGHDPGFSVRSCSSGCDAVATAVAWPPHLILIDAMMPVMDGPATLASLRQTPQTAEIPVIFMTALALAAEQENFRALGVGVITKPLDPMTLAATVRGHLRFARIAALRERFVERLHGDAQLLSECGSRLSADADSSRAALGTIRTIAHALAGAAGIFGLHDISCTASTLERAAMARSNVAAPCGDVENALSALMSSIARC
jgi:two-component system OmpR family response regulator